METLVWSHVGDLTAVSRFTDAYACCDLGLVDAELWRGDQVIYTATVTAPYYPTGVTLSPEAPEFLTPAGGRITRRGLSGGFPALPSCVSPGRNAVGHYVRGGGGAYVYVNWTGPYDQNDFGNARVMLCRAAGSPSTP